MEQCLCDSAKAWLDCRMYGTFNSVIGTGRAQLTMCKYNRLDKLERTLLWQKTATQVSSVSLRLFRRGGCAVTLTERLMELSSCLLQSLRT